MKKLLFLSAIITLAGTAQATLYTYTYSSGFSGGGVIPDGNPGGWSDTRTISAGDFTGPGVTTEIVDVNVRLNISGTYNGDLYGYLVHSSGFVVLLNRIGRDTGTPFGDGGDGMNITLDDQSGTDIHLASGVLSDIYNPDGRDVNPNTVVFSDSRTALLSSFNTLAADGNWTLFLADLSGGAVSTLVSWGLDIEVVPEPTTWALIGFAVIFLVAGTVRAFRARRLACPH